MGLSINGKKLGPVQIRESDYVGRDPSKAWFWSIKAAPDEKYEEWMEGFFSSREAAKADFERWKREAGVVETAGG